MLVGAFERDNFGDLLFLLLTERYLHGADVVAASPFSSDMTALLDRRIHAYGPLLEQERFDAVWTVGGQVGALDLRRAFGMSASPWQYLRLRALPEWRRPAFVARAARGAGAVAPYLPELSAYARNAGVPAVLNSAGLSGLGSVAPDRRAGILRLLRGLDAVAVRDAPSAHYLDRVGIPHVLAPDAVHALGVVEPALPPAAPDTAVVQVSAAVLEAIGVDTLAHAIRTSHALRGLRIRLLAAGTARRHDSTAGYERLADRIGPGADVELVRGRRPLELVARIRDARVVIGTSLHVRVVAAAYGVARVSLAKNKPTRYARTWDRDMPYGVTADRLDGAVAAALAEAERPEAAEHAATLAWRAHGHLEELAAHVLTLARDETAEDWAARAARRVRAPARAALSLA
jgi:hypothetical protein